MKRKLFLKALGYGLLVILGTVALGAAYGVLFHFLEKNLGKWGVIALAVVISVATLTAVIYDMMRIIDREKEE